jgi:prepilin-type N-terminal cleavage/methylation domain-containing protein/prepilin-type processing-associated H-X9-DG protein
MKHRRGFTIVEILVVVAIISLLIGLLLPALSSVKATARKTASMSNLRQWGVGTVNYCSHNDDLLPWEGMKNASDMWINFNEKSWWANAIPPFVDQRPYSDISNEATAANSDVPLPPDDNTIFVDPGARTPTTAPYWGGSGANRKQFFFCYVPNAQLNNTYQAGATGNTALYGRMKLPQIKDSSRTILMMEMRTVKDELSATDPYYSKTLDRHRSDWKRFAARHFKGGHMLFADGHAAFIDNDVATTNKQGTRNPNEPNGDWNTQKLIWDPMGPATDSGAE